MPKLNNIEVSKETHAYIKKLAKEKKRSMKAQTEILLDDLAIDALIEAEVAHAEERNGH